MDVFNILLTTLFALTLGVKYFTVRTKFGINPLLLGKNQKSLFLKILETTPILLTTLVIFLALSNFTLKQTSLDFPILINYIGMFVGLFSFYFLILGYYHLGPSWRIGVTNQFRTTLVTTGIFSVTRNPVYIFFNLFTLSFFLTSGKLEFLFLSILVATNLHLLILQEEKSLEKIHEKEYLEYKEKVPRYF